LHFKIFNFLQLATETQTMRFFITFSYKGTNYHGWQKQPNAVSVQQILENTLSTILNNTIEVIGAGRTDAGVHAKQMYAHFDYENQIHIDNTIHKINSLLPKDIVVFDIISVHAAAHARFDAKRRTYQYHINPYKNPFIINQSWYFHQKLNVGLMNQAAAVLLNHTNFQSFSKVNTDVNTFDCKIYEAFWTTENDQLIFTITADRFLRNMVRAIVGTLVLIGLEKISLKDFEQIIINKNRSEAGFSVPACGLFLTKIEYDYLQ
jgi:tRNA pseudouridine38-40 synthase